MANRIAALKVLYESGAKDAPDASVDQSGVSYRAPNVSLGLDSDSSILRPSESDSDAPSGAAQSVASNETSGTDEPAHPNASLDNLDASSTPPLDEEPFHGGETAATPDNAPSHTPTREEPPSAATPRGHSSMSGEAAATERTPTRGMPPVRDEVSSSLDESLSASLRAGQLARENEALLEEDEGEAEDQSSSGQWGVHAMRRRTAAGISAKSAQQKIDQLTAERDDLKIEVDFHRRKMSPDDVSTELISLRQEKLSYVRRLQKLNELVKRQDQALKSVNTQVKAWEARLRDYDALQARLQAAEQRARALETELERRPAPRGADAEELEVRRAREDQLLAENDALRGELRARGDSLVAGARDEQIAELRADLEQAERELEYVRATGGAPGSEEGEMLERLQRQADEQHETICALQDALAAERLVVAEKEGEIDRLGSELEAVQQDSHAAVEELREQLDAYIEAEASARAQSQRLDDEVQRLEGALRDAHTYHDGLNDALKEKLSRSTLDQSEVQRTTELLQAELMHARAERDQLLSTLDGYERDRAELEALNARLNNKVLELVDDLKDEERQREQMHTEYASRHAGTDARTQRALDAKDEQIAALEQQLQDGRREQAQHERDYARLQRALEERGAGSAGTALTEAERDRHQREARRLAQQVATLEEELARREDHWHDAEEEVARLAAETRELASLLQTERRTRLGAQDRLATSQRALEDAQQELARARSRRDELDRAARRASAPGGGAERAQLAERTALLASVYDALHKALAGAEGARTRGDEAGAQLVHSNYTLFQERLTARLRRLGAIHAHFEQRARTLEKEQTEQVTQLRRQQDTRWGQVERIERSIRAATEKQAQWRRRVAEKEAELGALQKANTELQHQVARARGGAAPAPPAPAAGSPARWSQRLRELETRCKEAEERVQRERLGARERAARDEARIRYVARTRHDALTPQPPADAAGAAGAGRGCRHPKLCIIGASALWTRARYPAV